MPKAVIIGATSGLGRSLARVLSESGYKIGITGRRTKLLESLRDEINGRVFIRTMDVSKAEEARQLLSELYEEMGGFDLVILNAGRGSRNPDYDWQPETETIGVNIHGFAALANLSWQLFLKQGSGHIVGISSVAAHLSDGRSTGYAASKAFVSNYLRGLDYKARWNRINIHVTNIEPGFVDTPMISGQRGRFWMITPNKAAHLIYKAIGGKRHHAYIPGRWRMIVWLLHLLPDSFFRTAGRFSDRR